MTDPWIKAERPSNWSVTKIGQLCNVVRGGSPRPMGDPRFFDGDIPFIKIADVTRSNGYQVFKSETKVNEEGAKRSRLLRKGDLILTNSATVCVPVFLGVDACIHDGFVAFDGLSSSVDQKFLYYFFKYIRPFILQKHKQGVTQVNLNTTIVSEIEIALPPLREQRHIVERIEELFAVLDEGMESLSLSENRLKAYQVSLLRAAFVGSLTRSRREGRTNYAPPVLALNQLSHNDGPSLPDLPAGWQYIHLGDLIQDIEAGKSFRCEEREPRTDEIGVAKVSAVTWGEYDESESKTCIDPALVNDEYLIGEGDFLFSRANTIELVGSCVIVGGTAKRIMLSDKTLRFKMSDGVKRYVLYYLRSPNGRSEIMRLSTGNQESMRNIGQASIRNIRIPVSSPAEMDQVVSALAAGMDVIEQAGQSIRREIARSATLRHSILAQAFSGRLGACGSSNSALPDAAKQAHCGYPKKKSRSRKAA